MKKDLDKRLASGCPVAIEAEPVTAPEDAPQAQTARHLRRREFLGRGIGVVGTAGLVAACGGATRSAKLVGSTRPSHGGGREVGHVTFGVEGDAFSMDPAQSYDFSSLLVVPSMNEPLLRMTNAGHLAPNLATAYDFSDPRRLVLKIRRGVRFHDGSPMTAEDVLFSLSRQLNPSVSLLNSYFVNVDHFAITGQDEVTAYMKRPDIQFLNALSTTAGGVVSKAFVHKWGSQYGSPQVGTMGTGPYRFRSWQKGYSFSVERNDEYWNRAAVPRKVKVFEARVVSDESTLITALRAGELDGQLNQISGRGVQSLSSSPRIAQYHASSGGASLFNTNVHHAPWNDARVRQALSLVMPRAGLVASVWGAQASSVRSCVPPSLWSYARSIFADAYARLPNYAVSGPTGETLKAARRLISAAGAHGAKGSIWVTTGFDSQQAQAIQAAAGSIGLHLSVNLVTQAAMNANQSGPFAKRPYDMTIGTFIPDLPDPGNMATQCWGRYQAANATGWSDAAVNRDLLRQFEIPSDPVRRARLITAAQAIAITAQPCTSIVDPDVVLSLRSGLGGYQVTSPQFQWDPQMIGMLSGTGRTA